jgi:hypothetical protein
MIINLILKIFIHQHQENYKNLLQKKYNLLIVLKILKPQKDQLIKIIIKINKILNNLLKIKDSILKIKEDLIQEILEIMILKRIRNNLIKKMIKVKQNL